MNWRDPLDPARLAGMFRLIADLGTVEMPSLLTLIRHSKHKKVMRKEQSKSTVDPRINDQNFSNPSRVLKLGDRLQVRLFTVVGYASPDESLAFLKLQGAVFTGVQGAALVYEQKRYVLPKMVRCYSFDEQDRLWVDPADGSHRTLVPSVIAVTDIQFCLHLSSFHEHLHPTDNALLCFGEIAP